MDPNEYMAAQTMAIKNQTMLMTFLTTLWHGSFLMITWDTLNGGIIDVWGYEPNEYEVGRLNTLIEVFLQDNE